MTIIDIKEVKKEWVFFLRNSDIFTTTTRGVTTTSATGTFAADSSLVINVTNVKNVRSVTVGVTTLTYGSDYTVDVDYLDTTIKCKITFTSPQTGAYTIPYDYGATDRIFPDFPRTDIKLSNFPRIGCGLINMPTEPAGFGGVNISKIGLTTIVYAESLDNLNDYITSIRTAAFNSKTDFYYFGKLVQIRAVGPILRAPREQGKDKIFQQNIDIEGMFNYEK
jgi:hypothetical protein